MLSPIAVNNGKVPEERSSDGALARSNDGN